MNRLLRAALAAPLFFTAVAANAQTVIETFESAPVKDVGISSYASAIGTINPFGASNNLVIASAGYTNFGVPLTSSAILTSNGNEGFEVLLATAARTVALDLYLNDLGPATLAFYNGATLLQSFAYDASQPNLLSASYTTPGAAITRFTFESTGGGVVNTGLDNIAVTAVPEPAAWAMLIGGFAMIGGTVRRRRRTLSLA